MARIRSIKPEFFRHELLQDLEISNPGKYPMMVFAGLWTQCDSQGVFEWRPRQLKLDILPFIPFDMEASLTILHAADLIKKYEIDGKLYGLIPTFRDHQRLSGKEAQDGKRYPLSDTYCEAIGKQWGSDEEAEENNKNPRKEERGKRKRKEEKERTREEDALFVLPEWIPQETWTAYLEVRASKRAAKTTNALNLVVEELKKIKDLHNHDPVEVLKKSIRSGWTDVYPLKDGGNGNGSRPAAFRTGQPPPFGQAKSDGQPYPVDIES